MFIRRLTYFIIVTVLAFSASRFLPTYVQTNWLIWSALSLSLISLGNTFFQRISCILLTGIGCAAGLFLASLLMPNMQILYLYLGGASFLLVYGMSRQPHYWLPLLIVNFFIAFSLVPDAKLASNWYPGELILLGTLIALVPQIIFWPYFVSNQIKQNIIAAISALQGLSNDVFFCLLQPDYPDRLYLYERRIHAQKTKVMTANQRLHYLLEKNKNLPRDKKVVLTSVLLHFDLLYESFMNCAQVRWRTTDHTIFAVCEQDISGILQEMNKAYDEFIALLTVKTKLHADLSVLDVRINQFEQTYQSVMQVTAREPIVLLLFVSGLQMFASELSVFNTKLNEARVIFK